MNKKNIIAVICAILFFFVAYYSHAVTITKVSGEIAVGFITDYSTGQNFLETGIEEIQFQDFYDNGSGVGAYGFVTQTMAIEGNQINILTTTAARSTNGYTTQAFETRAAIRSGLNPGSMLEFQLTPDSGEAVGQNVTLHLDTWVNGDLNSWEAPFNNPYICGVAEVDFIYEIFNKDLISYMDYKWGDSYQYDSEPLWWPIGEVYTEESQQARLSRDDEDVKLQIGDTFYLYIEQTAIATVNSGFSCTAGASAQAMSVNIRAEGTEGAPVPEPASFLLLGISLLGFGLLEKIKKIFPKKSV